MTISRLALTIDTLLGTPVQHNHQEVINHVNSTSNPHSTTAAQVGLGAVQNVDTTNASNITTGALSDSLLSVNITKAGNSFNGVSQLVKTTSAGKLPAIDGSAVTAISGNNISSGTISNSRLTSSVTLQGNSFNGVSQLVQTTVSGYLPILNGKNLTGITAAQAGLSNVQNVDTTNASNITTGTLSDSLLSTNITKAGNSFNGASQLVKMTSATKLPAVDGSLLTALSGNAVTVGTIADARLTANVTKAGNSFNGASQLVQMTSATKLPAVDGSLLTNLSGANISNVAGSAVALATTTTRGTIPATGTPAGKFVRDDMTWQYPPTSSVGSEYVIRLGTGTTIASKVSNAPAGGVPPGWTIVGGDDVSVNGELSGTSNDIVFEHSLNKVCVNALVMVQSPLGGWQNATPFVASDIKTEDVTLAQTKIRNLNLNIGSANSIVVLRFV